MRKIFLVTLALAGALSLMAQSKKPFPPHWGAPPEIQTHDYVELPDGYGHGSSTLRNWINAKLAADRANAGATSSATTLYSNNFDNAEIGKVPNDMMVLGGDFAVQRDGTNQFLALPGAPLDSFSVQFGPSVRTNVQASARIFGKSRGRRAPTFGVGIGGVSGWKAQVSPAKNALELIHDLEVKASVPYDWKSGTWTHVQIELRQTKADAWQISAKAWAEGDPVPARPLIEFTETEPPIAGRASIIGSPFAGTPIWYDDLAVHALPEK